MFYKVVTTDGVLLADHVPNTRWATMTEEEANARCKQANLDAVALGIQARYKVVPV